MVSIHHLLRVGFSIIFQIPCLYLLPAHRASALSPHRRMYGANGQPLRPRLTDSPKRLLAFENNLCSNTLRLWESNPVEQLSLNFSKHSALLSPDEIYEM